MEADAFQSVVRQQMVAAVPIGTDRRGRRWWMYKDEFFVEDERLQPADATALAEADRSKRQRRVGHAHAIRNIASSGQRKRTTIPVEVREAVWRRDKAACAVCGSQAELQFDHIIPVTMGGSNSERNLQLLCGPCNRRKAATLG